MINRWQKKVLKFRSLKASDKRLLVKFWLQLLWVRLELQLSDRYKNYLNQAVVDDRTVNPAEIEIAREQIRLLNRAAANHLIAMTCLPRSIVGYRHLCAQRLPVVMRIGARLEKGRMHAHAWLELGGESLDTADPQAAQFNILDAG